MNNLHRANPSRERLNILLCVPALVGAPHLNKIAELFNSSCDTALEEAVHREVRVISLLVHQRSQEDCVSFARW